MQMIHRNLTPKNVLVCMEGHKFVAKLSDLGISAEYENEFTSKIFGDPNWRAPEQFKNNEESYATDLYQLGCILFYAFTGGHHPCGAEKVREKNILGNQRVNAFLLKNYEASSLIANLLDRKKGICSISVSDAVRHPLFWESDRRHNFLRDSSEYIMNLVPPDQVLTDLHARAKRTYASWDALLDVDLINHMGGNYEYDRVTHLLRFIRNVISHYGEFPPKVQAIMSDGVEQYFALKFKRLLMDVYTAISRNCKENATFRAYFLP